MIRSCLLFLASGLIGVFSALWLPEETLAHTTWWEFRWNPPTSSNSCGWHDVCVWPYNPGAALDFGGFYAYDEVWALSDDYMGPWPVVIVEYKNRLWNNVCKTVKAEVFQWKVTGWQQYKLHDQWFVHVNGDQLQFTYAEYWGGPHQWWHPAEHGRILAPMMNPDLEGCPWDGAHAHVINTGPWVVRNSPPGYPNAPSAKGSVNQHDLINWTNATGFDWYAQ